MDKKPAAPAVRKPSRAPARTSKGRWVRTVETAERDGEAARMRAQGSNLREIAEAMGWATEEGARQAVMRAVQAAAADGGEELVTVRRAELDEMRRHAWAVVRAPGYVTSPKGDLVYGPAGADGEPGKPLVDQGARLSALNTLVRVSESERRLLGLDARDGLREREVRLQEAGMALSIRVLELAAQGLGMDVDAAQVSAVVEGAIVQAESEMRALPPGSG